MDLGITGKKVLITGGSRGLGLECAKILACEGAFIVLAARCEDTLKSAIVELKGSGHIYHSVDLLNDDVSEFCNKLHEEVGDIDIIIHALGGTLKTKSALSDISDWRRVLKFNMEIPIEINNFFVPKMVDRTWGRVVHISSIAAIRGWASPLYTTAKSALNAYSRGLGLELAETGVVVTAVMPGVMISKESGFYQWNKDNPEGFKEYIEHKTAIKRAADFAEIAYQVVFNCSRLNSYATGSFVTVDGGTY